MARKNEPKKVRDVRRANQEAQKSGRPRGRPKKEEAVQYEEVTVNCPKKMWVANPGRGNTGFSQVTCIKCNGTGSFIVKKRKT